MVFGMHTNRTISSYDELDSFALLTELRQENSLRHYKDHFYGRIASHDRDDRLELAKSIGIVCDIRRRFPPDRSGDVYS